MAATRIPDTKAIRREFGLFSSLTSGMRAIASVAGAIGSPIAFNRAIPEEASDYTLTADFLDKMPSLSDATASTADKLRQALEEAQSIFFSESHLPGEISQIGGDFAPNHTDIRTQDEVIASIEKWRTTIIAAYPNEDMMKSRIEKFIKQSKTRWNIDPGDFHTFPNYFLYALGRHHPTYLKNLLATVYRLEFYEGEEREEDIILYRVEKFNETRNRETIFSQGFQLQMDVFENQFGQSYAAFTRPFSGNCGVSLTKLGPLANEDGTYGSGYFVIRIPKKHAHGFLFVDVSLAGHPNELNSITDIPPCWIEKYVDANGKKHKNKKYSQHLLLSYPASNDPGDFDLVDDRMVRIAIDEERNKKALR